MENPTKTEMRLSLRECWFLIEKHAGYLGRRSICDAGERKLATWDAKRILDLLAYANTLDGNEQDGPPDRD